MLPHSKRLSTTLFSEVLKQGGATHTSLVSLFTKKNQGMSRFSVSVPKKVSKSAVGRNKIRRRVYSALKNLEKKIVTDVYGVIVMKKGSEILSFTDLSHEIEKIFVKSGILK